MNVEEGRGNQGEQFFFSEKPLQEQRDSARRLIWQLNQQHPDNKESIKLIMNQLFGTVGSGLRIEVPFYCDYGRNIHFGEDVFLNSGCRILDAARVDVGDRTLIGPGVTISTSWHPENPQDRLRYDLVKPVKIGADVILYAGVIVNPGVTIGSGSIIAAGGVVRRSIPDGVLAAGNPCKVIRPIR